jgi:hypothetical protein
MSDIFHVLFLGKETRREWTWKKGVRSTGSAQSHMRCVANRSHHPTVTDITHRVQRREKRREKKIAISMISSQKNKMGILFLLAGRHTTKIGQHAALVRSPFTRNDQGRLKKRTLGEKSLITSTHTEFSIRRELGAELLHLLRRRCEFKIDKFGGIFFFFPRVVGWTLHDSSFG